MRHLKSKKKGLSLEEKRTRMMEIFFETKEVFQFKDIVKIAPKTKGITPMSVKEVFQSLVDGNMVDRDKALHARKRRLEELDKQHTEEKQRKMYLQQAVDKSKVGREETEERATLLKELQALREKSSHLKAKLEKYRECDPEVIEEMSDSFVIIEFVSTDNVFAIKSWAKRKFGFDDGRIDKAFGIPDNFY
uniref:Meiotic nuclear division protein 1 homolog n=1 Tax=Salmo trutta TaxID=8032 RepID=A0A674E3X7_SALTR